jgi:hypothetical protein
VAVIVNTTELGNLGLNLGEELGHRRVRENAVGRLRAEVARKVLRCRPRCPRMEGPGRSPALRVWRGPQRAQDCSGGRSLKSADDVASRSRSDPTVRLPCRNSPVSGLFLRFTIQDLTPPCALRFHRTSARTIPDKVAHAG